MIGVSKVRSLTPEKILKVRLASLVKHTSFLGFDTISHSSQVMLIFSVKIRRKFLKNLRWLNFDYKFEFGDINLSNSPSLIVVLAKLNECDKTRQKISENRLLGILWRIHIASRPATSMERRGRVAWLSNLNTHVWTISRPAL